MRKCHVRVQALRDKGLQYEIPGGGRIRQGSQMQALNLPCHMDPRNDVLHSSETHANAGCAYTYKLLVTSG